MAMSVFYDYLLIGGMPEADRIFLETGSYQKARKTVIELYNHYLEDMPLYQASNESKLRSETIFKTIYSQLSKESKNSQTRHRPERFLETGIWSPLLIGWSLAHLVYRSTMVKERVSPSYGSEKRRSTVSTFPTAEYSPTKARSSRPPSFHRRKKHPLRHLLRKLHGDRARLARLSPVLLERKNDAEFEFLLQDKDAVVPIDVKKKKGTLNSPLEIHSAQQTGLCRESSPQTATATTKSTGSEPFPFMMSDSIWKK